MEEKTVWFSLFYDIIEISKKVVLQGGIYYANANGFPLVR